MLQPNEMANLEHLLGVYLTATSIATREAAWQAICGMCKRGGVAAVEHAAEYTVTTAAKSAALEAGEVQILKNVATRVAAKNAGKRGMTMAVEEFAPRFVAAFARCPKGPGPIVGITVVLTLVMTTGDVYAATRDVEYYHSYLMKYSDFLARRLAQGHLGRPGGIPRPLTFEEYQASPII